MSEQVSRWIDNAALYGMERISFTITTDVATTGALRALRWLTESFKHMPMHVLSDELDRLRLPIDLGVVMVEPCHTEDDIVTREWE